MDDSTSEPDDQELVRRFRESIGEEKQSAFRQLYRRHKGSLWRYILKMTGEERQANELTQETFLRALRNLDQFQGDSSFKTWLFSIAINLWRNVQRKKRPKTVDVKEDDRLHDQTPDDEVETKEDIQNVREALHALPDKFRIPLILVRFEDMTYQEAADTMGITLEALRMRVYRGQKALKEQLTGGSDE